MQRKLQKQVNEDRQGAEGERAKAAAVKGERHKRQAFEKHMKQQAKKSRKRRREL